MFAQKSCQHMHCVIHALAEKEIEIQGVLLNWQTHCLLSQFYLHVIFTSNLFLIDGCAALHPGNQLSPLFSLSNSCRLCCCMCSLSFAIVDPVSVLSFLRPSCTNSQSRLALLNFYQISLLRCFLCCPFISLQPFRNWQRCHNV